MEAVFIRNDGICHLCCKQFFGSDEARFAKALGKLEMGIRIR